METFLSQLVTVLTILAPFIVPTLVYVLMVYFTKKQ